MGKKKQQKAKDVKVVKEVSTTKEEATMEQQELVMDTPETTEKVTFVSNLSTDDMDAVLGEDASTEETKTITDVVAELNADFEEEKDEEPSAVMSVLDDIKATKEKKDKKKGDDEVESQTIKVNLISEIERFQFTKKKTEEVVVKTMINLLSSEVEKKPVGVAVLMEMLSFVSGKESTLSPSNRTDLNDIMDQAEQDFKANATKKIASFVSKELRTMITRLGLDKGATPNPMKESTKFTDFSTQTQMMLIELINVYLTHKSMVLDIVKFETYDLNWKLETLNHATAIVKTLAEEVMKEASDEDLAKLNPQNREILQICVEHPDRGAHALLFLLEKLMGAAEVEKNLPEVERLLHTEAFKLQPNDDARVSHIKIPEEITDKIEDLLSSENLTDRVDDLKELKKAAEVAKLMEHQHATEMIPVAQEMTALEEIRAHNHSETPMTYGDYMELRIRENKARIARLRAQ